MSASGKIATDILPLFIEEALEQLKVWESEAQILNTHPQRDSVERVSKTLDILQGAAGGMGLIQFSAFARELMELFEFLEGQGVASFREAAEFFDECRKTLREWTETLSKAPDHVPELTQLRKKILQLNPAAKVEVENPKAPRQLGEILIDRKEVSVEQVAKAVKLQERKLGEVMVEEGMVSPEAVTKALATQKSESAKKVGEQIRVPAARIDSLLKIIGELSIHQSIVWHSRQTGRLESKAAQNAITLSHKIIKEVQQQVMALRLQPLKSLFQKLERVARDVGISQNKSIETSVDGAEVDLDKAVIEKITDSLIHIVRNGIDHGIELPADRLAKGKSEKANLSISAMQDTSDVMLIVSDDGRGMDPQWILHKAIEKGFIAAGTQLRPSEIFNLIFLPGFSTAETVTEFSGRGVGMDVVNRVIAELGGTVQIDSALGKGTTFTISIPTSVSLIDAVVFTVDGLRYVVPMRELVEVLDLQGVAREGHQERGQMVNLRGDVVPVESLHQYLPRPVAFGSDSPVGAVAGKQMYDKRQPALLIRCEYGVIAFEVDEIIGQQQIVVRGLTENMSKIPGCVGGTILGDGEPGMIVGLAAIAREFFQKLRAKENEV